MGEVSILPVGERLHPDGVIETARAANLKRVVIVGWDDRKQFFYVGSESIEQTIYMLRNAEHELFKEMDILEAMG
jgi:hypothetical protein